ncbi:adenylyl-sulfate kinase, partial [Desulfobacter sp.]|uniref:adenylyl-sulfate kinase n=1 Tax=Desulfobacter sp. TaxID=2294 RepID=UPI003D0A1842
TRMRCYQKVAAHYPPDTYMLNLLSLSTRLAGPRDAVLHMIIGKNFGCSHFVIGHNHATPGTDSSGNPFYDTPQVRELTLQAGKEIGIEPVFFEEMVYLPFEDEFKLASEVKEGQETISFTNEHIRDRVRKGKHIPEWASFPDVINELRRSYPSPAIQGFTVFLTGLSGAGKSTIANVLYSKFMEIGTRPVTLLDGDIVRRNLSSELNFSKEHRDINVRRIGFVASEITKNRGIAICAPIAPYERTRSKIRTSIEAHGGFFEIHVSTPISVCEKRDRKGMYAKAKAGLLKGFTGVDDPYENPSSPELSIDTSNLTPDEAVQQILLLISEKGFV